MKNGFTLIEMLMVLVTIGILVMVSVPQYKIAVMSVRYNKGRQIAEEIYRAEQAYYMANGKVTTLLSELDVSIPAKVKEFYAPGKVLPPEEMPEDLLGVEYEMENGDELFINQSGMLTVSYTPKGMRVDYRLYYVPQFPVVTRECGVTSRTHDPIAYEEDAAVCRALGAEEETYEEDAVYGSHFVW